MVLIMVTSWYPPGKATEVGKKYLKVVQKLPTPSFVKPLVAGATGGVGAVKDGIEVISISEVEKGKFEEALDYTSRLLLEYADIEGFRYEIRTLMTVEEALPLIGLKMPAV